MKYKECYEKHKNCNGDRCAMPFQVVPWTDKLNGWYDHSTAIYGSMHEYRAKKKAEELYRQGGNYVVRPLSYLR